MSSRQACSTIGCTYRQLDYLTRSGAVAGMNQGSGSRRRWPTRTVIRLALANHMTGVIPANGDATAFPDVARAAMDPTEDPPRRGYAVLAPEPMTMMWAGSWADLRRAIDDVGAAVVVRYDLAELVGSDVDLSAMFASAPLPR